MASLTIMVPIRWTAADEAGKGTRWAWNHSSRSRDGIPPARMWPPVFGALIDATGSYDIIWWAIIVAGFAAALIHWPINDRPVARLAEQQT